VTTRDPDFLWMPDVLRLHRQSLEEFFSPEDFLKVLAEFEANCSIPDLLAA